MADNGNYLALLLGYDGIDENGLPIINPHKKTGAAARLQHARRYALNPTSIGDFQGGVGVNPNDPIPFTGLDDDRQMRLYESQTTWNRIWRGSQRLVGSTLLKTGQGIGFLGGMAASIFDRDYDGQN